MDIRSDLANLLELKSVVVLDPVTQSGKHLPEFLHFVRLLACFANRPFSCSKAFHVIYSDVCESIGIPISADLRLYFTKHANILRINGGNIDALLIPQNLGQQFPLLATLFIIRELDTAYLSLPISSHPNIASIPLAKQFAGLVPGGHDGRKKIFEDTEKPERCYFFQPCSPHLGHYVLNSLGPAAQALGIIRAAGASISIARVENGFLPLKHEAWLLDPAPPPSSLIKHFSTIQAMKQSVQGGRHAFIALYGSSVDLSLSITTQRLIKQSTNLIKGAINRGWSEPNPNELVLGISLRGGTREAVNLCDLIKNLLKKLRKRGEHVFVIIDGLALSCHNKVSTTANLSEQREAEIALTLLDEAERSGCRGISVVGWPLIDQLTCLATCDVVIAHEGSSSAKSMWLLGLKTIIHSPSPPVYPKPRRPELQAVGLQFRHAYRGETYPLEIRLPHGVVTVLPSSDDSREARQRRNYLLEINQSVLFIEQTLESNGLLKSSW